MKHVMYEEIDAMKRAIKSLGYSTDDELIQITHEKYLSMGGTFSYCGATDSKLQLEVDNVVPLVEDIAYSLGVPFLGRKCKIET